MFDSKAAAKSHLASKNTLHRAHCKSLSHVLSRIRKIFSGQCLEFLGLRASPKGLISNQPAGSAISKNQRLKCVRAAQRLALGATVRSKLKDPEGWLNCVFSLSPSPPPFFPPPPPSAPPVVPLFGSVSRRVELSVCCRPRVNFWPVQPQTDAIDSVMPPFIPFLS
jgi:hypothetical protein